MKFTKIKFKLVKSVNGTIQYWLDKYDFFETELNDPTMLENMKFFIGGQTTIKVNRRTIVGMIKNVRIEEVIESKESLFEENLITFS